MPVPVTPATRAPLPSTSVLIADTSPAARASIEAALGRIGPHSVTHANDGDALEQTFFGAGPFDLVVCRALLGARSGLQVLARARAEGKRASFIVYSLLETEWLRVFVSDAQHTVLSSRVVSLDGLSELARGMVDSQRRAARDAR